jgi:hypothetical protein
MKIYCINLDDRPEKFDQVSEEIKKLDFDLLFRFSATKGNPGFEGCRISHLRLLEEVKDSIFMVIEDDFKLCVDNGKELLYQAINELPDNWDMLYLGATLNEPLDRYSPHLFRLNNAWTTHAMIFNNQNGVIDYILQNNGGGRKIDVFYALEVQKRFNCFITYPMIATQRSGYSDVINRPVDYEIIQQRYNRYTQ